MAAAQGPLQLALLIIYPVAVALLVGFALTRGPEQSTVALYNAMPAGSSLGFGGEERQGEGEQRAPGAHGGIIARPMGRPRAGLP